MGKSSINVLKEVVIPVVVTVVPSVLLTLGALALAVIQGAVDPVAYPGLDLQVGQNRATQYTMINPTQVDLKDVFFEIGCRGETSKEALRFERSEGVCIEKRSDAEEVGARAYTAYRDTAAKDRPLTSGDAFHIAVVVSQSIDAASVTVTPMHAGKKLAWSSISNLKRGGTWVYLLISTLIAVAISVVALFLVTKRRLGHAQALHPMLPILLSKIPGVQMRQLYDEFTTGLARTSLSEFDLETFRKRLQEEITRREKHSAGPAAPEPAPEQEPKPED